MYYKASKDMLSSQSLNDSEKLLMIVVEGLSQKEGYCFATNQVLANMLGWDVRKINRVLASILKKDVLIKEFVNNNGRSLRKLVPHVKNSTPYTNCHGGYDTNDMGGGVKSVMGGVSNVSPILEEDNRIKRIDKVKKKEIVFPWTDEMFLESWKQWKDYKKIEHGFRFKSAASEQASLMKLSKMANTHEEASEIIMQSIENGWKGFFELKNKKQKNEFNIEFTEEGLERFLNG
jgi:hypothetical protein